MVIKHFLGTESQILSLTQDSRKWVEGAFYYPNDKSYFFMLQNGIMKKYGDGSNMQSFNGVGITLNGIVIGGVKSNINFNEILDIPLHYEYNIFELNVAGVINNIGNINIIN